MLAYHNNPAIKAFYLSRVRIHRLAGELLHGYSRYWTGTHGCAIGCTIHDSDHTAYERELGIPRVLASIKELIFEQLPQDAALMWPERFLESIPVGADLIPVWPDLATWLRARLAPSVDTDTIDCSLRRYALWCSEHSEHDADAAASAAWEALTWFGGGGGSPAWSEAAQMLTQLLSAAPVPLPVASPPHAELSIVLDARRPGSTTTILTRERAVLTVR